MLPCLFLWLLLWLLLLLLLWLLLWLFLCFEVFFVDLNIQMSYVACTCTFKHKYTPMHRFGRRYSLIGYHAVAEVFLVLQVVSSKVNLGEETMVHLSFHKFIKQLTKYLCSLQFVLLTLNIFAFQFKPRHTMITMRLLMLTRRCVPFLKDSH